MFDVLGAFDFQAWVLVVFLAIFFMLVGNLLFASKAGLVHKRVESLQVFTSGTEEEKMKQMSLFNRIKLMAEERVGRFVIKNMKAGKIAPLKLKLTQANMDMDPIQHWTQKFMYAMGLSAASLVLAKPMVTIGLLALGFFLPDINLNDKIKKRHLRIKSELPDFLDLLSTTAPAAATLENAIKLVCQRTEGEITTEFKQVLEEINTGRRTKDALKDLAMRVGIEEIDTLVAQINQSEAFGTGVEKTLVLQAQKMRKLKKVLAEIKASKASVLLLLPSLFLLFTCLVMIAGPSVMAFFEVGDIF